MSERLEQIYEATPIWMQNTLCSLAGADKVAKRYLYDFDHRLNAYEGHLSWSADRIAAFRDEEYVRFARSAVRTVPYYQRSFSERGLCASDLTSAQDVHELFPVLTKADVSRIASQLRSRNISQRHCTQIRTSGTTGHALRVPMTYGALRSQWAVAWRFWRHLGISKGTRCGWLAGRSIVPVTQGEPPYWRSNYFGRQTLFSSYHLSTTTAHHYGEHIKSTGLQWLHGYPSSLAQLAVNLLEIGYSLKGDIAHVTVSSESLTSLQRQHIREAFGVTPRQYYGNSEGVANASECKYGRLHLDDDYAFVETAASGPDASAADRIIGTNFTNPAFPLVRYEIGDLGEIADVSCPCGRRGRVLDSLDGRIEDSVVLPGGVRVGRLDHIFKTAVNVKEAQIYQVSLDTIVIRVVPRRGFSREDEVQLVRAARRRLGFGVNISVLPVTHLPRSPNGKLRFVQSALTTSGSKAV